MYGYNQLATTPCPASKRRTHTPLTRDSADEHDSLVFHHVPSDATYNPAIVLSTLSRNTRSAHVGSTRVLPSSPPSVRLDQSVLYSPWCPGTPQAPSVIKVATLDTPSPFEAETEPLLALGVTLGRGRWEVGCVSGPNITRTDSGEAARPYEKTVPSAETERRHWTSPDQATWHTSPGYLPVCSTVSHRSRPGSDQLDAIDALDWITLATSAYHPRGQDDHHTSSYPLPSAPGINFEPPYLDYPPAPRLAHCELLEHPLDIPDYDEHDEHDEHDEFDFGYIPGYDATPEWERSPGESSEGMWQDDSGPLHAEAQMSGNALRSPWFSAEGEGRSTKAFMLAGDAEEGALSEERLVQAANALARGEMRGLGLCV